MLITAIGVSGDTEFKMTNIVAQAAVNVAGVCGIPKNT